LARRLEHVDSKVGWELALRSNVDDLDLSRFGIAERERGHELPVRVVVRERDAAANREQREAFKVGRCLRVASAERERHGHRTQRGIAPRIPHPLMNEHACVARTSLASSDL
jgi:hypothetical protein